MAEVLAQRALWSATTWVVKDPHPIRVTSRSFLSTLVTFAIAHTGLSQDSTAIVSAFFGLDNALPFTANFLCPGAAGMDGMPVNFKYPIDPASLSAADFEVIDSLGSVHVPLCAVLAPANEDGENRTVLLIGELGDASAAPPVEVRIIGDLFTTNSAVGGSACSEAVNLNGASTTNVVDLEAGPSLFFAQHIEGATDECGPGFQTIQVAWNGGIVPFLSGDAEADLFQYYTGYSESMGAMVPHVPSSIADINDNDNYHQLCFATSDTIIKVSMAENTVEDPNQDPNPYTEIEVGYCDLSTGIDDDLGPDAVDVYPNPFSEVIHVRNLSGGGYFVIHDSCGRVVLEGRCTGPIDTSSLRPGVYCLAIMSSGSRRIHSVVKGRS